MRRRLSFCFLLALASTSHAATSDHYADIVKPLMIEMEVPVVGLAIIDHQKIIYEHNFSVQTDYKPGADALFQANSISKALTSFATLQLAQAGKISLDDFITLDQDSWQDSKGVPFSRRWTIQDVLNRPGDPSNGAQYTQLDSSPSTVLMEVYKSAYRNPKKMITVDPEQIEVIYFPSDSYNAVQMLLTKVTQMTLPSLLQNNIFQPLHMDNSFFAHGLPKDLLARAVPAYTDNNFLVDTNSVRDDTDPAAFWTTPHDLALWLINLLASAQGERSGLLSEASAKQMLSPGQDKDFGLGVRLNHSGNKRYFYKYGHSVGYYALVIGYPETGRGIVIMTDSDRGDKLIDKLMLQL